MKKILFFSLLFLIVAATATWLFWPEAIYTQAMRLERSMADLERKSLSVGKHEWVYLDGGLAATDSNVMVMIHGFTADKDNWNRLAREMNDDFHLIIPDLVGFGESSVASDGDYSIDAQTNRLVAFLEALGHRQVHLVGNSMGGYIAGVMAARYPDRVLSQSLLAPGGVISARPSKAFEVVLDGGDNALISSSREEFDYFLSIAFHEMPYIPGPVIEVLADRHIANYPRYAAMFEDLRYRSPALEEILVDTEIPTLIIWGEQDQILHPDGGLVLLETLPEATLLTYENVGHVPMLEQPERVASDIEGWFALANQ